MDLDPCCTCFLVENILKCILFFAEVYTRSAIRGRPKSPGKLLGGTGVLVKLKQTGHGKASAEAEERATVHLEDVERVTKILGCHSCYWRFHHGRVWLWL